MLHDSLTVEEVVDSESALEFMKEATKLATSSDLEDLSERIARKAEFFGRMLEPEKLERLTEDEFGLMVRQIFSIGFGIQMQIPVRFPWLFRKKSIYLETPRERHT